MFITSAILPSQPAKCCAALGLPPHAFVHEMMVAAQPYPLDMAVAAATRSGAKTRHANACPAAALGEVAVQRPVPRRAAPEDQTVAGYCTACVYMLCGMLLQQLHIRSCSATLCASC